MSDSEFLPVVGIHVQHATATELCTGTLLSSRVVLTAAHCLAQLQDDDPPVRVFTGSSAAKAIQSVQAAEVAIHPEYCPPNECKEDDFDIAYIVLAEAIKGIEPIEPITDQDEYDDVISTDARVTLVGFGATEDNLIGVKHKVTTTITGFTSTGYEFYAGGDGKDSCNGDSGGPALVESDGEWRLAGVLSRGYECGEGGVYGVPFPALCWLRDETDLDLLPSRCSDCECVDVSTPVEQPEREPERGCRIGGDASSTAFAALGVLLALASRRRRS